MIDWFLIFFTDFLWWAGNSILCAQNFVNQNSFDEGLSCDSQGLARVSYINIFLDIFELNGKHQNLQTKICYFDLCIYLKHYGEQ